MDGAQLSGHVTARLDGAWGDMSKDSTASVSGNLQFTQLRLTGAALGADTIHLDRVDVPCKIRQKGESLEIDELAIQCDLGHMALNGSAKLSDFSAPDVVSALAHENLEVKGQVDLARLARMLPGTLQIRAGTEITSGQVEWSASARQLASGTSWTGLIETTRLAATSGGRPFAWEKPLTVQFAAHESDKGVIVDRAVCTSSFLQASAAGSLEDLTASADFDLAQLVTELRQFSDLGGVQLAGQGRARLTLKRTAQDQFSGDAEFQARNFQYVAAGLRPWQESHLVARLSLAGHFHQQSLKTIDSAKLSVETGSDRLETTLRQPIADLATAEWPLDCSWRGQLAPWSPRLESCLALSGWELNGTGAIDAAVRASAQAIRVENATVDLKQLQVVGNGWFVNEPAVVSTLEAQYDMATGRAQIASAKLTAGTTVATLDRAAIESSDTGWSIDGGNAHLEGELAQLMAWRQDPRAPSTLRISGRLSGDAQIKHAGDATSAQLSSSIDRLEVLDTTRAAAPGAAPAAWREPRLTLAARGSYAAGTQQLRLDALEVSSNALRVDANGALNTSSTGGDVDLKGTLSYDWVQLAPLWRPYLGSSFEIAGRQSRDFAIRGKLTGSPASADSWKNVGGQAGVGWTSMNLYGLRAGPGDVAAQLAAGQISTKPIEFQISEGRLTSSPTARLTPAPAELFLPAGPLLTNVRLSPDICAQGLRFVTPLLADATVAEGRFSITLDGGRVPLADPQAADIGGRMAMKGQIKPGPIAGEFVGLIKELITILRRGSLPNFRELDSSLMSVDSSNIEFRMVNRRVYHRGLTLVVGTTPVTTEGSVGLDESLALIAEVPINARLLGADLSLGALEGKKLKIPISGTLKKPKLDRRALQEIPLQLIENTARDVLLEGLNKGLERLLPPTQPQP
jgi:hypothetical protein